MENYLLIAYAKKQGPQLIYAPTLEAATAEAQSRIENGGWDKMEIYTAHSTVKFGALSLEKSQVQLKVEEDAAALVALQTTPLVSEQPVQPE